MRDEQEKEEEATLCYPDPGKRERTVMKHHNEIVVGRCVGGKC